MNVENVKYLFILLILISGCSSHDHKKDHICHRIDLNKTEVRRIYIEEIADSVEYIRFETSPECLFDDEAVISVTPDYVIVCEGKYLLFDRHTGKFIRELGKKGQGPDEYWWACSHTYQEKYPIIYADKGSCWIGYDVYTGQVCDTVSYPDIPKTRILGAVNGCKKLDSETYIGYVNNISGRDSLLVVYFNKKGEIISSYPNWSYYADTDKSTYPWSEGHFFNYRDSLLLKPNSFNDTVYKVYPGIVSPHIVFDLGDKSPTVAKKENEHINIGEYLSVSEVWEVSDYVLFNYWYERVEYTAFYNKETKQTTVCTLDMKSDIQGLSYYNNKLPSWNIHSVNSSEEVIGILSTDRIMECMKTHSDKSYPEVFRDLKEDDNPIVVIVVLR